MKYQNHVELREIRKGRKRVIKKIMMRYYLDYFYDQVGASVVYDMIAFALIITLPLIIKTKGSIST